MSEKLYLLMKDSVLVQGAMALILLLTICYMAAMGLEIPTMLANVLMVMVGFYFGQKVRLQRKQQNHGQHDI